MNVSGRIDLTFIFNVLNSLDLSSPSWNVQSSNWLSPIAFANGTASGQIDMLWGQERDLTHGVTDQLDRTNLINVFGETISMASLVVVYIGHVSGASGLDVQPNDGVGAAETIAIREEGHFLRIENTTPFTWNYIDVDLRNSSPGQTGSYRVLLAGRSA